MHCDQCGKENRSGSKFCRHCGVTISPSSETKTVVQKLSWKSPVIIILVVLILLGGVSFGGYKAYAYFKVQSKIHSAEKFQGAGDFSDSISAVTNLGNYIPTDGQQKIITTIKSDDQKFVIFKASFDAAIALENTPSPTSADLQTGLADLQSIDPSYPEYKAVQTETTKVQNLLVTALQNDASTNKEAATAAQAKAASATAAQARAERNAEEAQNEADSAAANAASAQANTTHQVYLSFYNQLTSAFNSVDNNEISDYNTGNSDYEEGTTVGYLDAIDMYSNAETIAQTAYTDANNLSNFTNMPQDYVTAGEDMASAANDFYQAASIQIANCDPNAVYASPNTYNDEGNALLADVNNFLTSTTP